MNECDVVPIGGYPEQQAEALFFLNQQGEFSHVNEQFTALTGHTAEALLSRSLAELVDPDGAAAVGQVLAYALHGHGLTFDARLRTAAGTFVRFALTTFPQQPAAQTAGIGGILRLAETAQQTDSAVREREKQLSIISRTIADVIFVLKVETAGQYRFLFVNKAFTDTTGLRGEQVVNRLVQDVIPEPSLSMVLANYQQAVATKRRVIWLETSNYPTGQVVGEVCVTPVLGDDGECCQLVGVVHDLTAQHKVEEDLRASNERFRYALKATTDALYDWDIQADTLLWGEGFEDLFGYHLESNPSEFGQWSDFVHPDDAAHTVDTLLNTAHQTTRNHWQQEYRFQRADGTWATVFDRGYIIRDEQERPVRMIGAMQDISARKEAEAQQQRMAQELFAQNADLQQFTYIVSHNLRAPLANARGYAQLLTRLPTDSEAFATSLGHMQTSLEQLDIVLNDINDILSIRDKPAGRQEKVHLSSVCEQVRQNLAETLSASGGTLTCTIPPDLSVVGNRAYFHSIFYNLLANAIQYRSAERPLHIEVEGGCAADGNKVVTVADNGSGFDLDKAGADVFQLYKRFHTTPKGRGIGLFLVKSHVEAMGGRIEVSSRVGEGTRFTLSFS
ncbi:PAS domain S-box protein [Hymenobacter busanensis]|nr:PAS domain S-box protein [Hymenobacter busanensis]QHJ06876.1 PAS domain S-box protein [Hymenobacter busanensis]